MSDYLEVGHFDDSPTSKRNGEGFGGAPMAANADIPVGDGECRHDPLCEWSTPCFHGESQKHSRDTENLAVPDATYCWVCGADCCCDLIAKVREDERGKPSEWITPRLHTERMRENYDIGYAGALRDATEAVNKVMDDLNSSAEWDRDYDADPSGQTRNPRIWVREAVSAIESLKAKE